MRRSRSRCGERKVGSITKIPAAGFSGIAGTTWAVARSTTSGRSSAGEPCAGTPLKSDRIVRGARSIVARASARRCCTGHMIHGRSERAYISDPPNEHRTEREARGNNAESREKNCEESAENGSEKDGEEER